MVICFRTQNPLGSAEVLTYISRLGVNKKVMGYPTPKDLRDVTETAEMTSKVSYQSRFSVAPS